jgi:hypothetical protein
MSNTNRAALAAITTTLVITLPIALLPAVSLAARPENKAARACAEAFVATLATPGKPAPRLKGMSFYGIDDLLGAPTEIALTAFNPQTRAPVARATCVLSATGKVMSITAVPLAQL